MKSKDVTRAITLTGLTPIMFDRYAGDNMTELRPDQKLYLKGETIILPALNIFSLLTAEKTQSAPKRFLDSRKYKMVASAIRSYVTLDSLEIPFLRDGEPIVFGGFNHDGVDERSGCYVHKAVARLDKGIPNPKVRPVLPLPWELKFGLLIFQNDEVQEETIQNLLVRAGPAIGLGTFRGVYGKFRVTSWD